MNLNESMLASFYAVAVVRVTIFFNFEGLYLA